MARLYPQAGPTEAPSSERAVFDAFRSLPDSYSVLWDVPVGLFGKPRANLRQIDVLVIHEHLGIIVIEVKGGDIRSVDGDWFTRPRGANDWIPLARSPYSQAADQRFALRRYLTQELRLDESSFCHAVAFPGCTISTALGPDAPRELVIDEADLQTPAASLHRVREHWGDCRRLSADQIGSIVSILKPTFEMTIVASSVAQETSQALERETRRQVSMVEDQVRAYQSLLDADRVVVIGGAGTGKTVIAAERAKQLARTGSRTLLLCHRAAVRAFLFTLLDIPPADRVFDGQSPEMLQVASWGAVAQAVGRSQGQFEVRPLVGDLVERFLTFRDGITPFDALVIDEGQEFTPTQIEALCWLLDEPDRSPLYLLADPFQHSGLLSTTVLDRREKRMRFEWQAPIEAQTVVLTTNCRNSQQVLNVASRFYPGVLSSPVVEGPPPQFHQSPPADVLRAMFRLVSRLLKEDGFQPNQLLAVAVGKTTKEVIAAAAKAGVSTVDVDSLFRFPLTPKDLRVATGTPDNVQGLEADVVVVGYAHGDAGAATLREFYIAASRARSVLHVVSDLDEDELLELSEVLRTVPAVKSQDESPRS